MGMLKPATNKQAYAKIGLYGAAGSGKTYTAAKLAIGLAQLQNNGKPVGMFDTEPAASYIIPLFREVGIDFQVYDESRALRDLMDFMDEAERDCSVIIVDSITHVWREAQAAYLAKVNDRLVSQRKKKIASLEFHHWGPIKAQWAAFTDKFLAAKAHVIVCGRAGGIYEYQKNEQTGKMELITVGTRMATEKELGYEPSLLIEMVMHRENGRIINRALVEKDRTARLNGQEFDYPTFETFKPHFDFLNIGGEHHGSMMSRDSKDMYEDTADGNWDCEKRNREIWCEEVQGLLTKYFPSQSANDKQAKSDWLDAIFKTRSWTKVQSLESKEIKRGYEAMKAHLDAGKTPGDLIGQ